MVWVIALVSIFFFLNGPLESGRLYGFYWLSGYTTFCVLHPLKLVMLWLECQQKWKGMVLVQRYRRSSRTSTDALESALPQIHKRTNACTPIKHTEWMNRLHMSFRKNLYTKFHSQIWCQRLSRAYSKPDTWDTSSRVLSLAKWILHSADMWYLNFPLGGDVCRSEKAQWCLLISEQAVNGNLASQLQCVMVVIRMKWWRGTPERVTSRKTDCCYSQGHLHRSLQVSLKTNYHLLATQPDHCDLLQQIEIGHYIDLRHSSLFTSVNLFKLGFQFPIVKRE